MTWSYELTHDRFTRPLESNLWVCILHRYHDNICNLLRSWEVFFCIFMLPLLFWTLAYTGHTKKDLHFNKVYVFICINRADVGMVPWLVLSPKAEISEWALWLQGGLQRGIYLLYCSSVTFPAQSCSCSSLACLGWLSQCHCITKSSKYSDFRFFIRQYCSFLASPTGACWNTYAWAEIFHHWGRSLHSFNELHFVHNNALDNYSWRNKIYSSLKLLQSVPTLPPTATGKSVGGEKCRANGAENVWNNPHHSEKENNLPFCTFDWIRYAQFGISNIFPLYVFWAIFEHEGKKFSLV